MSPRFAMKQSVIQAYSIQPDGELVLHNTVGQSGGAPSYSSRDIANFLAKRLPYSLPLLRRLQLGLNGGESRLITTLLPVDAPAEASHGHGSGDIDIDSLWAMAVVDRDSYPSAEVWTLSTLELYHGAAAHEQESLPPSTEPGSLDLPFTGGVCRAATAQLLQILSRVPVTSRRAVGAPADMSESPGAPGSHYCLAGGVHSTTAALLAKAGVVVRSSPPYGRYLFGVPPRSGGQAPAAVTAPEGSSAGLPDGLVWSRIGPSDYADVMAVNRVVRSASTIAKLTSVAVRAASPGAGGHQGGAIAFAFASGDGSVRTLHVDPAYRRLGLAKAVVTRLLGIGPFLPPETGPLAADEDTRARMEPTALAFTGIESSNIGSIRTFQTLGGKWYWDIYYLWLDLDVVAQQMQR